MNINFQNIKSKAVVNSLVENKGFLKPKNGWIVIPSLNKDPKNIERNYQILREISNANWCTSIKGKSFYLNDGDVHIYFENTHPKVAVFTNDKNDTVTEIVGEANNYKIPMDFYSIIAERFKGKKLGLIAKKEVETYKQYCEKVKKIREDIKSFIKNNDVVNIFKYFGIGIQKDGDGKYILEKYVQPSINYTLHTLGIDENKLLKDVKMIKGNAILKGSRLESLLGIAKIGGNADIRYSRVRELGGLGEIGGNGYLNNSDVETTGELRFVGGLLYLGNKIKSLGKLKSAGSLYLNNSPVKSLGEVENIQKELCLYDSELINLGKLKTAGCICINKNTKLDKRLLDSVAITDKIYEIE